MENQNTYSPEVRERAVRMVEEHRQNYEVDPGFRTK